MQAIKDRAGTVNESNTETRRHRALFVLRILNEDNEITIFSLIGRNDLMAESM